MGNAVGGCCSSDGDSTPRLPLPSQLQPEPEPELEPNTPLNLVQAGCDADAASTTLRLSPEQPEQPPMKLKTQTKRTVTPG